MNGDKSTRKLCLFHLLQAGVCLLLAVGSYLLVQYL